MTPTKIVAANIKCVVPDNWNAAVDGDVGDLWVRIERLHGEGMTVAASAWLPSPAELALLNQGHAVVLRVFGSQPVVSISVEPRPIEVASFENMDTSALVLPMLVLYADPVDYPGKFIVRLWDGPIGPTNVCLVADTIEAARATIPARFTKLDRNEKDDPTIVESYV